MDKILVIHPEDETTDCLSVVYEELDCTLVRSGSQPINNKELVVLLESHDIVIMLGHGLGSGLIDTSPGNLNYNNPKYIINQTHVEVLKKKKYIVGIWCFANDFFERYELNGFYSGMIISEIQEARHFDVDCNQEEIDESNEIFSDAIKVSWNSKNPIKTFKTLYNLPNNRVWGYNKNNIHLKK